jgi:hypothetical protein
LLIPDRFVDRSAPKYRSRAAREGGVLEFTLGGALNAITLASSAAAGPGPQRRRSAAVVAADIG